MDDLCKKIQQRIAAYIDGELPGNEHQELEAHLQSCRLCKKYEQETRETDALLRENISFDLPPEVDLTRIWEKIEPQIDFKPGFLQKLKGLFAKPAVWVPAIIAAGATAAVMFVVPVSQQQSPLQMSRVESVSSQTGQVMVFQTAESSQPIIWIMSGEKKEASS